MQFHYLAEVRSKNPLIHNITNIVAAHFSANGLLAVGASPIMADSVEEMEELAALSSALVLNIGTLDADKIQAMLVAGRSANRAGVPVVLDPVGVGATAFRRDTVQTLLQEIRLAAIRGNAGEMAQLAGVAWSAKGVDAGSGAADVGAITAAVARRYETVAVVSGETDYVSDGLKLAVLNNGTPLLPSITTSGCLLSAVCGAFLAVAPANDYLAAAIEACTAYGVAAERAAAGLQNTQHGTFMIRFIDSLAAVTTEQVAAAAKVRWADIEAV
ncbi:hydroxyethylthiazole kinase [Neisseria dentiae]|uniref:Hydroxyethylthiazole kinase n=1 Tax=Neisseria dentiae TaxID=194197 RepID=A0A1X3DED9_9NEIS|nr:hydroxyethylthiazole kinase [Neisseria dentiae]OSI18072.1 hydroxyethylthiazole kinase [Neisseria dentiae]QMT45247.1 hydroxyethylthiazole kinase [Neisseria dentiae]STZ51010.1 Hydroxyethylthiazole kinase [Neisseria dentiae]